MYVTKRQRQIYEFIKASIETNGYAPSLQEIGAQFNLSSLATIHKHLTNLEEKGLIVRHWNRSRAIELTTPPSPTTTQRGGRPVSSAVELPLLGRIAAGQPLEAVQDSESILVPPDMVGRQKTYVLRVTGDSMIEEHIREGDYVIVEERQTASNGDTVVALIDGDSATLKKFFREGDRIRLQPANATMQPIYVTGDRLAIQGIVIGILRKYRAGR
ncbi:MAG: transcriptional repressor LexA [Candidatus Tectomicrobia bacterium]|nr:transcriptional repressor LexA [Candidatus Tectomicrobia bacterium]